MAKITITYKDLAVGAAEAASASDTAKQSFSVPADIFRDDDAPKYATLEHNYFKLDGSWPLFPDDASVEKLGIWSLTQSGSDNKFAAAQQVEIYLSSPITSVGLTLYFDSYGQNWPTDMDAAWYRDSTLLSSGTYAPDGAMYFINNAVQSYNKLVLTFREMNAAGRYLKLSRLKFGRVKVFQPDEYRDLSIFQTASPISDTLEDNPLSVTFRHGASDDGISYIFQSKQQLAAREGEQLIGVWYIDTHDQTGANAYDVDAIGLKGVLDRASEHMGGLYTGETADVVMADIMGSVPYTLDDSLKSVQIYGWLPKASRRDNAKQLAFALGALVDDSQRESIYIRPPETGAATDAFTGARAYEKGKISTASMVTRVDLTVHGYTVGTAAEQLYSDTLTGTITLDFSEPYSGLVISGGTIESSGANYAVITGTGGTVVLTGVKYVHSSYVLTKSNPLKTTSDTENPRKVTDMTLVSAHNAESLLQGLYDYYLRVKTVSGKVVTGNNYPGQRVTMETVAGEIVTGNIISMDWKVSAKQAAEVVVLADA